MTILYERLFPEQPEVMDVEDIMKALGIGKNLARDLMNEPDFPLLYIGSSSLKKVLKVDLICYITRKESSQNR